MVSTLSVSAGILLISLLTYFLYKTHLKYNKLIGQKQLLESYINETQSKLILNDQFFSTISHDLRGSVASLKNRITLLKLKSDCSDQLDPLEWELNGLYLTLDNAVYDSLIERNNLPYSPRLINLSELMDDVLDEFTSLLRYKKWVIKYDRQPASLILDERCVLLTLRNVIHYLLNNIQVESLLLISIRPKWMQTELVINTISKEGELNDTQSAYKASSSGARPDLTLAEELMKPNGGKLLVKRTLSQDISITLSWPTNPVVQRANKERTADQPS